METMETQYYIHRMFDCDSNSNETIFMIFTSEGLPVFESTDEEVADNELNRLNSTADAPERLIAINKYMNSLRNVNKKRYADYLLGLASKYGSIDSARRPDYLTTMGAQAVEMAVRELLER